MKVLVAVDETFYSKAVAREAVRLFGPDAFYCILSARTPLSVYGADTFGAGGLCPILVPDLLGMSEDETRDFAAALGCSNVSALSVCGDTVDSISAEAERLGVDAIVIGRRHRSIWERIFAPSLINAVLRSTTKPVVVVQEEAANSFIDQATSTRQLALAV